MVVNKYSSGLLDATVETFQSSLLSTIYINKTNALRALDKANCVFCCNVTTLTLTNNKNNLLLLEKNISSNSSNSQSVDVVKRSTLTPEAPMIIKE
ncbi:unnamed protein product [Rotaria magnacalcarata]